MVAQTGQFHRDGDYSAEIHFLSMTFTASVTRLARLEHLLYCAQEAVRIFQHDAIKVPPFMVAQLAALQGLQVKPNGGDWGLELVRDGVQKAVLLLVAA